MNTKEIEQILQLVKEFEIAEIEFEREGAKLIVKKYPASAPHASYAMPSFHSPYAIPPTLGQAPANQVATPDIKTDADTANLTDITSPIVGTFYSASSPESPPFVARGKVITPNDTVCIIEAMKVMNEIKSDISGTVVEILVQNGQSVEFGQVLFKVKQS